MIALLRLAVASLALAVPLLPLAPPGWLAIELATSLQLQALLGLTVLLALLTVDRGRFRASFAATLCLATLATAGWVLSVPGLPPTPGDGAPAQPRPSLTVLSVNLLGENRDAAAFRRLVAEVAPDVLVLLEVRPHWAAEAEMLPLYPHRALHPLGTNFGIGVVSRRPILGHERFGPAGSPALEVAIAAPDGAPVRVLALHPWPPMSGDTLAARDAMLAQVAARLGSAPRRTILAGDLNATPWSPALRKLVATTGLIAARSGHCLCPTWPASLPTLARIPIDHVFTSPDLVPQGFGLGPNIGSDHLPVWARVAF